MKKLFFISLLFIGLNSFVVLNVYKTSGGHPSSTGAPGEATCADATTGCHSNAVVSRDTTNTVNTFQFSEADSSYTAGSTYTITLSAAKSGINKFGFEVVALDANNKNQGAWVITDATRTHIITGTVAAASRKYVTHSTSGTPPVSAGLGQWSFKWTAPSVNVGNITFYYATNCTNNNGAATGDQLFLSSFQIHPSSVTAAVGELIEKSKFQVQYLQASQQLQVNYRLKRASTISISILDMQGKLVQSFAAEEKTAGKVSESLPLTSDLRGGMYFVNLQAGDQIITEKIVVSGQ